MKWHDKGNKVYLPQAKTWVFWGECQIIWTFLIKLIQSFFRQGFLCPSSTEVLLEFY